MYATALKNVLSNTMPWEDFTELSKFEDSIVKADLDNDILSTIIFFYPQLWLMACYLSRVIFTFTEIF